MTDVPGDASLEPDPWPVDGPLVHAALAGTVATLTALTDGTSPADLDRLPQILPAVTDLDLQRPADAEVLVAAAIAVTSQVHDLLFHTGLLDDSLDGWDGELDQLVACGLEGVHHVLVHHADEVASFVTPSPTTTLTRLGAVLGPVVAQLAGLPEDDRRPLLQLVGARADLTARLTLLDRTLDELLVDDRGLTTLPPDRPDLSQENGAVTLLDWLHDHQAHQQDPSPEELPPTTAVAAAATAAAAMTTAIVEHFELAPDEAFAAFVPFASTSLLLRTLWSVGGPWVDAFAHELAAEAPYAVAEDAIETVCTLTRLLGESDPDGVDGVADELVACFQVLAVVDHHVLMDDMETVVDHLLADPALLRAAADGNVATLEPVVQEAVRVAQSRSGRDSDRNRRGGSISVTTTSAAVTVTDRAGRAITLDDPADVALVIRQLRAWADEG